MEEPTWGLTWGFDPASARCRWNEELYQDYQRHFPEGLGYQILRPGLLLP